jgi:hypothetical protein
MTRPTPLRVVAPRPGPEPTAGLPEPLVGIDAWVDVLCVGRRQVERLRSAGRLPAADLFVGRLPRWRPETLRDFVAKGGRV